MSFLVPLHPVIAQLTKEFTVRFVVVGGSGDSAEDLPFEIWPWTSGTEVQSIQLFDIGIMPLFDTPWERGKCGYKLIQYMAVGKPVVASPVGINKEIVQHGVNGFLASDLIDWHRYLSVLLSDEIMRHEMGMEGRNKVDAWYSLQIQAPRVAQLFKAVATRTPGKPVRN